MSVYIALFFIWVVNIHVYVLVEIIQVAKVLDEILLGKKKINEPLSAIFR